MVGILSDKKAFIPAPNASEVEAVFDTPLEMFLKVLLPQSLYCCSQFFVKFTQ